MSWTPQGGRRELRRQVEGQKQLHGTTSTPVLSRSPRTSVQNPLRSRPASGLAPRSCRGFRERPWNGTQQILKKVWKSMCSILHYKFTGYFRRLCCCSTRRRRATSPSTAPSLSARFCQEVFAVARNPRWSPRERSGPLGLPTQMSAPSNYNI